jgi:hypothetical protein
MTSASDGDSYLRYSAEGSSSEALSGPDAEQPAA